MVWPFRSTKVEAARLAVKYQSVMVGMGQARWLNRSYRVLAYEGFETNPVVFACVTKLARALSSVDLHLYRRSRWGDLVKVPSHSLLDLINNPNAAWSGRQFMEKLATQYLIGGNAFVFGNNGDSSPPSELWLLPAGLRDGPRTGRPHAAGFLQVPPEPVPARRSYPVNQVTGRSALLHLRTVNPLDEWHGLPPLAAAAHGVDIFNAGQEWNKALLQNEGRPSGALQMRPGKDGFIPTLTDDQFNRLKAEVEDSYSGPSNAGRPMLLDSALEWVQMSLSSKDMDHRETMLTNARFIAACFGTPPQLVNIPGESTFNNYQQATMAYWGDTVLPLLGILLEDINRWLPALFGEKVFLWYDEEQIPALEPRREEKSKRINLSEFMTINEKREAMGLEAYVEPAKPGADSIFVNARRTSRIELAGHGRPEHPPRRWRRTSPPGAAPEEAGDARHRRSRRRAKPTN